MSGWIWWLLLLLLAQVGAQVESELLPIYKILLPQILQPFQVFVIFKCLKVQLCEDQSIYANVFNLFIYRFQDLF